MEYKGMRKARLKIAHKSAAAAPAGETLRESTKGGRTLPASFTIEAALLVPVLLSLIFLVLQSVIYLHDTVWAEAWVYQQAWKMRWAQETGGQRAAAGNAPSLAVLRYLGGEGETQPHSCRFQASFQVCFFPRFVAVIYAGQSESVEKQASERVMDTPGFIRIAGAILEEGRE